MVSVYSLAVDATGVYVTGNFNQVFHPGFGLPDVVGNGVSHMFVSHFDNAGAVDWAVTNEGTGAARGKGIAVDADGTIYLVGTFSGVVDFDPDPLGTHELTNPMSSQNVMFLLKLRKRV